MFLGLVAFGLTMIWEEVNRLLPLLQPRLEWDTKVKVERIYNRELHQGLSISDSIVMINIRIWTGEVLNMHCFLGTILNKTSAQNNMSLYWLYKFSLSSCKFDRKTWCQRIRHSSYYIITTCLSWVYISDSRHQVKARYLLVCICGHALCELFTLWEEDQSSKTHRPLSGSFSLLRKSIPTVLKMSCVRRLTRQTPCQWEHEL